LHEYSAGIGVLSPNAELVTVNVGGPVGGAVVLLVAAPELVGPADCGFTLPPPHAGSAKTSSATVASASLMGVCIPAERPRRKEFSSR
jgi:hypothetical protein